jgi:hypothetical protein
LAASAECFVAVFILGEKVIVRSLAALLGFRHVGAIDKAPAADPGRSGVIETPAAPGP